MPWFIWTDWWLFVTFVICPVGHAEEHCDMESKKDRSEGRGPWITTSIEEKRPLPRWGSTAGYLKPSILRTYLQSLNFKVPTGSGCNAAGGASPSCHVSQGGTCAGTERPVRVLGRYEEWKGTRIVNTGR